MRVIKRGVWYFCQPTIVFGKDWVDLTSLRSQVKDLKSVYLRTRAKTRDLRNVGEHQIKSGRAELS